MSGKTAEESVNSTNLAQNAQVSTEISQNTKKEIKNETVENKI